MKGQTEIIIVLGVVVIAAFAVLFATNKINLSPPEPESISQLKETLRADLEKQIAADSFDIVKKVASNGGYLDAAKSPISLDYKNSNVPYWQFTNTSLVRTRADFEFELSKGIKDAISKISAAELTEKFGKEVRLDPRSVEAKILDRRIDLKIDMPASLEGFYLQNPIEISVPVKLGEAIKFATETIEKSITERVFESFTIGSILAYQVRGDDGNPTIPSYGILRGCGKSIHRTWWDVKPEMETLLKGMLDNVHTAGKVPVGIQNRSTYLANSLPVFTGLETSFSLGASTLDERSFQMFPNPLDEKTIFVMFTPICISPPYQLNYWLLYPVVGEVGDSEFKLKFAFNVYINGYKPGDIGDVSVTLDAWKRENSICQKAVCDAKIRVTDAKGPVSGAQVSYAGCYLGLTDEKGIVQDKVPCGRISLLEISKADHNLYSKLAGFDELKDKAVNLQRRPLLKLNLYNIEMTNTSGKLKVLDVKPNNYEVSISFNYPSGPVSLFTQSSYLVTKDANPGPAVSMGYSVKEGEKNLGGFGYQLEIPEADSELWLYSPVLVEGIDVPVEQSSLTPQEQTELEKLLQEGDSIKINNFLSKLATREGIPESQIGQNDDIATQYLNKLIDMSLAIVRCGESISESLPASTKEVDANKIKGCSI